MKTIHLVAVALWLGGLLILASGDGEDSEYAESVSRVSAVALMSVVIIAATGLVLTFILVPSLGDLMSTSYGIGVLVKAAGLAVLVAFGAYHRTRSLPGLGQDGGPGRLRSTVRLETVVMIAVILTAGFLARISPPERTGAPRITDSRQINHP